MTSHDLFEYALDRHHAATSDWLQEGVLSPAPRGFRAERGDLIVACLTVSIACLVGIAAVIA